ncbi:MAG: shikimate dehydrogenase [Saprospiraceae bacterium]|jgi:shikimate dehydrogenase|nr:shikimate dehydrogenase [Saprospiraceae bacterium]MBP9210068.1 shikimate dehydrogenase [Saprospiraceae bacterium]
MSQFGLTGRNLEHSRSPEIFRELWLQSGIVGLSYECLPVEVVEELPKIWERMPELVGMNVTIPYKETIIPLLSGLSPEAAAIGAVNCIVRSGKGWLGHNTDGPAFLESLNGFIPEDYGESALVLGTGGASKAVCWALKTRRFPYRRVSRSAADLHYGELPRSWDPAWKLIINTTPLGMWPEVSSAPELPYKLLDKSFYLYDLVYNPENTLFLALGEQAGCRTKNGLEMLRRQAELSWLYWNEFYNYGRNGRADARF